MRSHCLKEFQIPLRLVQDGVTEFAICGSFEEVLKGDGFVFEDSLGVKAKITTVGEDYLLDLEVKSEAKFICDRCREIFKQVISNRVQSLYTYNSDEDWQKIDNDIKFLKVHAKEIDLTEDIRDALILAVPPKILCNETCLGLCPTCGTNLNLNDCQCSKTELDSRWDGLKKIKFD